MPIYEYLCRECGTISEFFSRKEENEALVCKSCGSCRLEKVLSRPAVFNQAKDQNSGRTCCGREERCSTPPCSNGEACWKE